MDFANIQKLDHITTLQEILPENYNGVISECTDLPNNEGFFCVVRLTLSDKETALEWLREFEEKSKVSHRVLETFGENSQKVVFKKSFGCRFKFWRKTKGMPSYADPYCNSKLMITIKNPHMKKSKDVYLKNYPCEISIRHNHKHPLNTSTQKFVASEKIKSIFKDLFSKGHSPSSALTIYKNCLLEENEKFDEISAGIQEFLTLKWSFDLYYSIFKQKFVVPPDSELLDTQRKCVEEYNRKCGDTCAIINADDNLVLAICSPIMKKVHQYIKVSSEVMFVDSSGNCERQKIKTFLCLCPSVVGALPLGIVMTYSETENAITEGIQLLKSILPSNSFFGKQFPRVIISDDCNEELKSLQACFQSSTILLSRCHIMQETMRFLWNSKNYINEHHRVYIYELFRNAIDCLNETDFLYVYETLLNEQCIISNNKASCYFKDLLGKAHLWALCYRTEIITSTNEINNCDETTFRILKDNILSRKKPLTVVQLYDYLTTFEHYYFKNIIDIINAPGDCHKRKYKNFNISTMENVQCVELGYNLYEVHMDKDTFIVNYELELCTCSIGRNGAPCKHQSYIEKKFGLSSQQIDITLVDKPFKKLLLKIVYGDHIDQCTLTDLSILDLQMTNSEEDNSLIIMTISEVRNQLQDFVNNLMEKYENKFEEFSGPVNTFLENIESIKTDGSLINALCNFGKCKESYGVEQSKAPLENSVSRPKRRRLADHAYYKS